MINNAPREKRDPAVVVGGGGFIGIWFIENRLAVSCIDGLCWISYGVCSHSWNTGKGEINSHSKTAEALVMH